MRRLLSFVILFLIFQLSYSNIYDPHFQNLTIEDGLPHNTVCTICKDKEGFIWIGTNNGLCRYDGINMKIFKHNVKNPHSINNNYISYIFCDQSGTLWVGTRKGLNRYNNFNESFESISFYDPETNQTNKINSVISCITQTNDSILYIATLGQGLIKYDKHSNQFKSVLLTRSIDNLHVSTITIGKNQEIYLGIESWGLLLFNPVTQKGTLLIDKILEFRCLYYSNNELLIGSMYGMYQYNLLNNKLEEFTPVKELKSPIQYIKEDTHGVIWICTETKGIILFDKKNNRFQKIDAGYNPKNLSSDAIYCVFFDNNQATWIGTMRGGVEFWNQCRKPFFTDRIRHDASPVTNCITSFVEIKRDIIWMSSDGGGIHQYNLATQSFEENPSLEKINALAGDAVISLIKDDFNNIWIGSYGNGLIRYNLSSRSLKRYTKEDSNLSSNFVWSLYVDQSGQLWIGTITYGGFASFNYNKDQIEKINIQTDNVLVIKELSDNKIALGCYNGIIIYEPDVKKSIFFSTNYAVRSIIETDEQKLLIGSETDGLKYVDLVKGDIIPVSNPLESLNENIITAIIADVNKNLWISTSNGLFRYMEHSKELDIYNTKDGIQGMEFNFSSVLQTLSGKLLFGGTNGFTFFDPLKIVPDTTRYPLLITDFSIHNQSVFSGPEQKSELLDMLKNKNIVLKYNQGNFSFDFIAISFNNPSIIKYAYMLEGIENSWNYTSSNRSAYYSRLAPGKYTFKIKYATQLNLWNNTPLEIKIRVLPPFYMTWWAYSAYFIIITLIILIIIRIQRRENKLKQDLTLADIKEEHTKELQTMREQFFINISHELRTPLTLIISPLKDFINSHPFNPPNLTELQNIYSNANRLLSLINRLLLFRKTEMGKNTLRVSMLDIVWFSRKIFDSFNHLAQKKDIDYSFSSTNESVNFLFDPEKMEIILYNLLSNAFKYTPEGGAIILQLEYKPDDQIRIKVSDSGCGIEENEFDKIIQRFYSSNKLAGIGIGLSLVKNYTELMGGTLHIESKVGIGSSFSMLFNLRAMYKDSEIEPEAKKLYTPSQTMIENIENIYLSTKEQIKSSSIDNNGKIAKILIVEDNKEISDYIKKCLSVTQKYEILEAEDGISALNIARSELPEIIISDIHMPNMNGLELCESIKNNIETNHIYFILITADVLESTENKGLSMGADEFITKPFDSIKLLNKVNTIQKYYQKTREHFETQIQSYSPATREHSINNDFINMCITNVRSKYNSENFNPITLAQMMNMSHSSLYKKIKLFTGQSVSEFIRTIRLTIAAELIQEGKLTISEIAFEVGISDSKYFRQCFKKQYGTLPSDYNKKNPPKQQT